MSTTPSSRRRSPRGSGEQLREEILVAARDLLEESGSSASVSIRAVAGAVGVTPPSIYLHFADKDALLDAVVADVFAELDAAMMSAAEGIDDPMGIMSAYGLAYVRFAIDHPEQYRLATMERRPEAEVVSDVDAVLAESAFKHMLDVVSQLVEAQVFVDDPMRIALHMWVTAHGVASMVIAKPFLFEDSDPMEFAYTVLCSAALGLGALDLAGGTLEPHESVAWLQRVRAADL